MDNHEDGVEKSNVPSQESIEYLDDRKSSGQLWWLDQSVMDFIESYKSAVYVDLRSTLNVAPLLDLIKSSNTFDTSFILSSHLDPSSFDAPNIKLIDPALLTESILSQPNIALSLGPCSIRFIQKSLYFGKPVLCLPLN